MDALAFEEIRRLKARYFRAMDTKDWAGLRAVFTDDADFGPGVPEGFGPDGFVATCRDQLAGVATLHHGHNPELELTGEDTATGIWQFDWVGFDDHGAGPPPAADPHLGGYGQYEEVYRKFDGEWRISQLHVSWMRLRSGTFPELQ